MALSNLRRSIVFCLLRILFLLLVALAGTLFLGVGLAVPATRKFAAAGAVAYLGYLILNTVRARR